jgi:hypothetical protein
VGVFLEYFKTLFGEIKQLPKDMNLTKSVWELESWKFDRVVA